jgi:hypothetical protein
MSLSYISYTLFPRTCTHGSRSEIEKAGNRAYVLTETRKLLASSRSTRVDHLPHISAIEFGDGNVHQRFDRIEVGMMNARLMTRNRIHPDPLRPLQKYVRLSFMPRLINVHSTLGMDMP